MKTHNSPFIPRRSSRLLRLFALAVTVLLTAAACSSDGDESVAAAASGAEPAQTTAGPIADDDSMEDDDAMADDAMADESHDDDAMAGDAMADDEAMADDAMADGDHVDLALDFTGLETLGAAAVYEGWVIVDGLPVTTGRFNIDADGNAVAEDGDGHVFQVAADGGPDRGGHHHRASHRP